MKEFDDLRKERFKGPKPEKRKVAPKLIAEHTVVEGDTLSEIALKYYGNAGEQYYMYIFEKNKAVIGDNPNMIMVGIKLMIYELTEDLKDE